MSIRTAQDVLYSLGLWHLPYNGLKSPKPSICLFSSRGVKYPLIIWSNKFAKSCRIAMSKRQKVTIFMFCLHMKYIHRESNFVKIGVLCSKEMCNKVAIVVIEYIGWE